MFGKTYVVKPNLFGMLYASPIDDKSVLIYAFYCYSSMIYNRWAFCLFIIIYIVYGPLITNKMAIFLWSQERGSDMQLRKSKPYMKGVGIT